MKRTIFTLGLMTALALQAAAASLPQPSRQRFT